ncbi:MAG: DUF349 domain-containing protein [Propionibacteriaceae bacterium]|jgi:polyhydroxyalkanoate synthesis regulator phasin|nr:DUF349 domain-containing protein [Propionibacteriaceae bacterium]
MTETPRPSAFGRVGEDGTVYVRVKDTERSVGQVPDATPEQALAFFQRRADALEVEADLLAQRVRNGAVNPDEARRLVQTLRTTILEANAVGDLEGIAARLDPLTEIIQTQADARREEKAKIQASTRARKEEMIAYAEKLGVGSDWGSGVQKFRDLLDEWKTLPRLDRASDDELWHRFSTARTTYTRRRKTHFADLSVQQEQARELKEAIIAEAEGLAQSTDWGATASAFRQLMNRWKVAGGAGRHVDDGLWTRFRAIQDAFFNRRTEVFTAQDEEYQTNLTAKNELLADAESTILPVSDVAKARGAYRDFIQQFNAIGRVPTDQVRSVEARVKAIETAIDEADKREWARTDPQTRARAQETVNLFSAQIDKLREQLSKAEAKGDKSQISKTTSSIATYQIWLDQAQQTLDDLRA